LGDTPIFGHEHIKSPSAGAVLRTKMLLIGARLAAQNPCILRQSKHFHQKLRALHRFLPLELYAIRQSSDRF